MVLPLPEVDDLGTFMHGIERANIDLQVGEGARLVDTTKVNWIVLFEALQNDVFKKWEQADSPVYCEPGVNHETMDCTLDVHY